ncbi:MAG: hypothetical protein FD123_1775 [Bacteroidetes bacterium]|nr:MAG: hypothetical protein FD123_1775 [Bacteroidota bacterium]
MDARLSFLTLGVNDLEKSKRFYMDQFGWKPIKDSDGIVFFKLNGFILALFPKDELAEDAGVSVEGSGFKGFSMAINMRSEEEVNTVFAKLEKNGVKIVRPPEKVFWGGYRGYIADNEDHLWEIAYNPFLELDENGNVKMHA